MQVASQGQTPRHTCIAKISGRVVIEMGEQGAAIFSGEPFGKPLGAMAAARSRMRSSQSLGAELRLLVPASLDRHRITALAQLEFINRAEVLHFLGPPGTGKFHLATAIGVAAVRAGRKNMEPSIISMADRHSRAGNFCASTCGEI